MTHDVLRLNIRSEHPDEIPFHLEDGRHPDGSEARDAGSRTWPSTTTSIASFTPVRMPAVFQVKRDFVRVLTANVQPKNIMCHRPGELLRLREVKGDGLGS